MFRICPFVLLFFYTTIGIFSQWQPDVRLTNDTLSSVTPWNNSKCIAAYEQTVHVVWSDFRDGNWEIYYKRSTDAGISWGSDTRLTNNTFSSLSPSLSLSAEFVHVVWTDSTNGTNQIAYKRSTNGGESWSTDTMLTSLVAKAIDPSLSVVDSDIHLIWYDLRAGHEAVYYKRSTDGGVNWDQEISVTSNATACYTPSVSASGPYVHVTWHDYDVFAQVHHRRSTDRGVNWGVETQLTSGLPASELTCVSASDSIVHVTFISSLTIFSPIQIFYAQSTNAGANWGEAKSITNTIVDLAFPSISVSGTNVHVVWNSFGNESEIYYKNSTDYGINWGPEVRLTNHNSVSEQPSLSVNGENLHVVWTDKRDGNNEIYYKRNPTGNAIGIQNISSEIPSGYSLLQNYPNPFNPTTNVRFNVPTAGFVTIKLFDILGHEAATLVNKQLSSGTYEINWDGSNFGSGIYFYRMSAGNFVDTRKMILMK